MAPLTTLTRKPRLERLLFTGVLLLFAMEVRSTMGQEPVTLKRGATVQRALKGGETHAFQIKLAVGQFVHVEVEPSTGFDLMVVLLAPDGKSIIEMNGQNGSLWREALSCVAPVAGFYKLQIKAYGSDQITGAYTLNISQLRKANERDAKLVQAEQALAAGRRLNQQSTRFEPNTINQFETALGLWRELGDKYWEAVTLANLGWLQNEHQVNDKAMASLNQALVLFRELKDATGQGKALNGLGLVYHDLNQFEPAKNSFESAIAIRRELKDRRGEASSLYNLSLALQQSGQLDKAAVSAEEALVIYQELKITTGVADVLSSLAGIANSQGNYGKALEYYQQALIAAREQKSRTKESLFLISMGGVYNFGLNQYAEAKTQFQLSLSAARDAKDHILEALALTGLGIVSQNLNQYEEALGYEQNALTVARQTNSRSLESLPLSFLVSTHNRLKQYEKAKDYADQLVKVAEEEKDLQALGSALNSLAMVYYYLGKLEESRQTYERALAASRQSRDRLNETIALSGLGLTHRSLNQPEKALDFFTEGLALARDYKNRANENLMLLGLAEVHYGQSHYEQSGNYYQQALIISRELKDKRSEANMLNGLGSVAVELSQYDKATELHNQALIIFRELKDKNNESNTLNGLGRTWFAVGQYDKAQEAFEQALEIKIQLNENAGREVMLSNLGVIYTNLNQYDKAQGLFDQAAVAAREVRNHVMEGLILRNVGGVYFNDRSQYEKARGFYEQALATSRQNKDKRSEGGALDSLATVDRNLGQYEQAREEYQQALTIFRESKSRASEALVLHNLGTLYNSLSRYDRARDYFEQALAIHRDVKDRRSEGGALDSLGLVYKNLNQFEKAKDHLAAALAIFRELKVRQDQAASLNHLGEVARRLKQPDEALAYLNQALSIEREINARRAEGTTLDNLGSVYKDLRQYEKAHAYYQQALVIFREIKVRQDEAEVLGRLMENTNLNGQPRLAVFYGKQAVNAFQEIRGNIKGFEQDTKHGFLKDKEPTYRSLAAMLISQGRLPEARAVLELLKEEEFSAAVRRDVKGESVPYDKAEAKAIEILNRIAETARLSEDLRLNKSQDPSVLQRKRQLDDELSIANKHFAAALKQISTIARHEESYRTVATEANSLMSDLAGLPGQAVALYTVIVSGEAGPTSGWIILVTPTIQKAYPIDVVDLQKTIFAFQSALRTPTYDPLPLAQKLYRMLFLQMPDKGRTTLAADLDSYLKGQKSKTLMWSLDGVLRYVPLAALHDGRNYLVETYRNVVFNTSSRGRLKDNMARHWSALGFGVSEGREEAGVKFDPLPGADRELRMIVKDKDSRSGILPGVVKQNKDFTLDAIRDGLNSDSYSVVHISSHFSFQSANFEESFLLLGQGHWTVGQMREKRDLFRQIDLVTLSACETAMGQANGKETEGFAFLVQDLGAKSVIASLWPVDDIGTQVLMPLFYRLRETGQSKAEAFQRAQLALLHGEAAGAPAARVKSGARANETAGVSRSGGLADADQAESLLTRYLPDPQKPFAHPYYWAPFILIGNWK